MSTAIRTRALAAFFAVTTGALVLIGAPAQAATGGNPGQSCWLDSDNGVVRCFSDETALQDAVAASGRILVEEGSASARHSAGLLSSFVIARFYDGGSYGGATFVITNSSSTICTTGPGVGGDLTAFNDRVSSFHSYYSCVTRIFVNTGGGGSYFGYVANAASVGALNNLASSYLIV